ncbi:HD-GYP domain-containing protein [Aquimonas voraii]|uniref:HDIG domain-containing protein n=1 Tax=Aquimonas voraii TaxID=265719 RepID=A0A1G6WBB9_9GAMM|nr:HD-GYP domain-containing protein [Aquimonas voraii]SDD63094.1 HDIG domain-containing protein [Aquimonas voraii]
MIKAIPIRLARPGMWFHRLGGDGTHPVFFRHSFLLTAQEIDVLRRGGVAELLIDTERGLDCPGWPPPGVEAAEAQDPAEEDGPVAEPAEAIAQEAGDDAQTDEDAPSEGACEAPGDSTAENATEAHADSLEQPPAAPIKPAPPRRAQRAIEAELQSAQKLCLAAKEKMVELFSEARMGKAVSPSAVEPLVEEISASVTRNPDALISVARLKRHDDYTYLHSVAVCALMIALARQLRLPAQQIREAGIGGMLHDIGKAAMPLQVLNKPGALTDDEYRIMKAHPVRGYEMLKEGGAASAAALEIALHHHEKYDGTGYPHGQAGEDIDLLSRMGAVCDVYDAISSNRPYKKAWSPAESVRRMAAWKGHFDPQVFNAFVKSIGIYPVGALVRLQSDLLAVVTEQHDESLLTPKVRIFFNAKKREPVFIRDLDLASPNCADRIAGIESPETWNFPQLEKLWMPG